MFFIGIEVIHRPDVSSEIIDIAAVLVGENGREKEAFQTAVNPGEKALAWIYENAVQAGGLSLEDLRAAPSPGNAAEGLQTFLKAHPGTTLNAFNLNRAKKLLSQPPWDIREGWGICIRHHMADLIEDESVSIESLKLYDVAKFLKIPIPIQRRAISDARLSAEIFGKLTKKSVNMADIDFLSEAQYIIEDGL